MYPSLESRSVFVACLLRFHHISLAGMASFTLSTYCNGLVIYLGMYVALPWQQILSDIDFVPAAAVYLTHH